MADQPIKASEWDRAYFRRIGEWEAENARRDLEYHLSLPLIDRLHRSANLSQRWGEYLHDDREPKDLGAFYERAKELGLYKSSPSTEPCA